MPLTTFLVDPRSDLQSVALGAASYRLLLAAIKLRGERSSAAPITKDRVPRSRPVHVDQCDEEERECNAEKPFLSKGHQR